MSSKVENKGSAVNNSKETSASQNKQPNKVYETARKIFITIKNIPLNIYKKIKATFEATYKFLTSHKFAIAMIAFAIIFAPISGSATAIAITLGTVKEAYSYYTHTIDYQFKLKAKTYVKVLTDVNSNFKDGKIVTSQEKVGNSLKFYAVSKKNLLNHIINNVQTKAQLDSWTKYLKNLSPQLKLQARVNNKSSYEIFSTPQPINEHIDAQMQFVKQTLEQGYSNNIAMYAKQCLVYGKKNDLKPLCTTFMKRLPFAEKVLQKTEKDILNDLNWSYQTQRITNAVKKPFKAIVKPFQAITESKPFEFVSTPINLALKFIPRSFIFACAIGLVWKGMPKTLQIMSAQPLIFAKFMCWKGNTFACDFKEAINNVFAS